MKSLAKPKVVELIRQGALISKDDLALAIPCHQRTAQRILDTLHAEGLVRIVQWVRMYTHWIPVYGYKAVPGTPDKVKPKPVSNAERQRKARRDPLVRWQEAVSKRKARARAKAASAERKKHS